MSIFTTLFGGKESAAEDAAILSSTKSPRNTSSEAALCGCDDESCVCTHRKDKSTCVCSSIDAECCCEGDECTAQGMKESHQCSCDDGECEGDNEHCSCKS